MLEFLKEYFFFIVQSWTMVRPAVENGQVSTSHVSPKVPAEGASVSVMAFFLVALYKQIVSNIRQCNWIVWPADDAIRVRVDMVVGRIHITL